ncbi:MAG: DEAD/DEAH box helicase [Anaerolineae bacterium]|nr:DEAD/DEAH box helicase [Anaerolineae bacterium]
MNGDNVLLCAATASGKTAAALAPLIERYLPPLRPRPQLTILYLLPTRALVNDLYRRLAAPLNRLQISYAVKTRDLTTLNVKRPADLLLTTPESLDSLLAADARLLNQVRAVVIDELHEFDGTVRGDQLRILLNRLRQVRAYAHRQDEAEDSHIQFVALSATASEPVRMASRYFDAPHIVEVVGRRSIDADLLPLDPEHPTGLLDYLHTFQRRGWRKALVFCNTRAEVEAYATFIRRSTTLFGEAVFVHYSNLDRHKRAEIESQFSQAEVALCFASSTLELGIDIGDIDAAILVGAPGSASAFTQRIGRAGRRRDRSAAACFYRNPLERHLLETLIQDSAFPSPPSAFHTSVVIQQIFSLLKQSPQAAVRLSNLNDVFAGLIDPPALEAVVGELQMRGYLQVGRAGEWRVGPKLNTLVDLQSSEHAPLSLYSNIQNTSGTPIAIRDRATQQVVAHVDRQWFERETLTLEGRAVTIEWYDGEALWVSQGQSGQNPARLRFRSARQVMSYPMAQALARHLGIETYRTQIVALSEGCLWFHWLGDVYGHALQGLMRAVVSAAKATSQPGLCLLLPEALAQSPNWTPAQVVHYLKAHYRSVESMMALGAYHGLLPNELRRRAVQDHFGIDRFLDITARWTVEPATEAQAAMLSSLLLED